ncbi:hypothetical protein BJ742DRAFT_734012 [Cladochytrium replicatum]|nr:hypothetical protein BJ742DRAFT_734012 [Cladochytrium replicatum]
MVQVPLSLDKHNDLWSSDESSWHHATSFVHPYGLSSVVPMVQVLLITLRQILFVRMVQVLLITLRQILFITLVQVLFITHATSSLFAKLTLVDTIYGLLAELSGVGAFATPKTGIQIEGGFRRAIGDSTPLDDVVLWKDYFSTINAPYSIIIPFNPPPLMLHIR